MMPSKSQSLILLHILTLFVLSDVSAAVGGRKAAIVGGYQPIKDLKAKEVQEIARFAVTEHNKEAKTNLKYQEVLRGETQVVSGTNYRLLIEALTGTVPGKYQAVVWVKPWQNYRNLTSFEKFEG